MREFLHDLIPYRNLSKKKALVLLVFIAGWCLYYFPFFENAAERRFFSYDPGFLRSYIEITKFNGCLNDFLAQFNQYPVVNFLTHFALAGLFLICAYRIGGRYAVFMLPLWLTLSASLSNAEQDFIMGILASMVLLSIFFAWISYREDHKNNSLFFYEVFYLNYWIFYVIAGFLLIYLNGVAVLLFFGNIVLYRLLILLFSLGKYGKGNIDSAVVAFGAYFITGFGISFAFPEVFRLPDFMIGWGWIKWTAFCLFFLAIFANLFQSTARRNLHKPTSSTWPFLLIGIAVSSIIAVSNSSPLKRSFVKAENAIVNNNYAEALQVGRAYFDKHPVGAYDALATDRSLRYNLSLCVRLALLKENKLNEEFFTFRHVPEMQGLIDNLLPYTTSFNFSYAKLYYETELYGSALPLMEFTLNHSSYQRRVMKLLLPIEAATYQRDAAKRHIQMMKKSPGNRKFALQWEKILLEGIELGIPDTESPVGLGLVLNDAYLNTDNLISAKVEKKIFPHDASIISWQDKRLVQLAKKIDLSRPVNREDLEYFTMLCLLNGRLDAIPEIVSAYAQLEIPRLPTYLQEAVCLYFGLHKDSEQKAQLSIRGYMGYRLDAQTLNSCNEVYSRLNSDESAESIENEFGQTYFFYYFTLCVE